MSLLGIHLGRSLHEQVLYKVYLQHPNRLDISAVYL